MANLCETATWEAGIYQWETSDPVMGGENGIDNKPTRQLANRTVFLKNEIAKVVQSIGANKTAAEQQYALKTTSLTAGAGLTGGGVLRDNMTLSLGTPSKITASTTNSAVSNTHTHEIDKASTSVAGIVKLNNTLTSTSQTEALTAAMGKKLSDEKLGNSGAQTLSGSLTITQAIRVDNPTTWHAIEMASGDGTWVLETSPSGSSDRRFQFKFAKSGEGTLYCRFPAINQNEIVAYQSWVSAQIQATNPVDASTTAKGIVQLNSATNSTIETQAATPKAVKVAYDLANTAKTVADGKWTATDASTTAKGIVQLNSATNNSTIETQAATPKAVKTAFDKAVDALNKANAAIASGAIAFFAGNAAPNGWLKANGAAVSRTTYAALFAAIGTTYGAGDGSTTFNLPEHYSQFKIK